MIEVMVLRSAKTRQVGGSQMCLLAQAIARPAETLVLDHHDPKVAALAGLAECRFRGRTSLTRIPRIEGVPPQAGRNQGSSQTGP